jgi:hypothetical protein
MLDTRIILSGLWVATMLTYLWGDVLRIFAGDVKPGEILGVQPTQGVWLFIAALMLIPIVMVVLTLTLKYPAIRWANIIAAIFWVVFNIFGMLGEGYPGAYDYFLLIVSFVFNAMTVWYAWKWVA